MGRRHTSFFHFLPRIIPPRWRLGGVKSTTVCHRLAYTLSFSSTLFWSHPGSAQIVMMAPGGEIRWAHGGQSRGKSHSVSISGLLILTHVMAAIEENVMFALVESASGLQDQPTPWLAVSMASEPSYSRWKPPYLWSIRMFMPFHLGVWLASPFPHIYLSPGLSLVALWPCGRRMASFLGCPLHHLKDQWLSQFLQKSKCLLTLPPSPVSCGRNVWSWGSLKEKRSPTQPRHMTESSGVKLAHGWEFTAGPFHSIPLLGRIACSRTSTALFSRIYGLFIRGKIAPSTRFLIVFLATFVLLCFRNLGVKLSRFIKSRLVLLLGRLTFCSHLPQHFQPDFFLHCQT